MERLTYKAPDSEMVWFKDKERLFEPCEMDAHQSRLAIAKLATYEQAEEQGLLLRLPCKVGTQIYAIIYNFEQEKYMIIESKVAEVTGNRNGWFIRLPKNIHVFRLSDFGVRVFLRREEAKAKLAEMEGAK